MHAVELIYSSLKPDDPDYPALPAEPPKEGICCITGVRTLCYPRESLLGPSFTNVAWLKSPNSATVGVAAYVALKYKWERASAWICDGTAFRRLDRKGVRQMVLFGEHERPWAGYATTCYKKHGALLAPVNRPGRNVWLWDVEVVDCSQLEKVLGAWSRLKEAQAAGIGRPVMESLDCPAWMIKAVGVVVWRDFERWARPLYKSSLYRFLVYLLPSQQESDTSQESDSES